MAEPTILSVRDVRVHFKVKGKSRLPWAPSRTLKAVDGVSFDLKAGETLGVVGESGCGKSTLSRAILNLIPATQGEIVWMGSSLSGASPREWHGVRRDIQMIFQDPLASLDPRMTVGQIIAEPLREHRPDLSKDETMQRVRAMMAKVGLREQMINRYAHEFSGGQCQRIGIARALIVEPKLVVCDEPVSALDVSIQAQIVNLLQVAAGRDGACADLHRARSRGGQAHLGSRDGHVPWPRDGACRQAIALRHAASSLYARAAVGGAGARPSDRAPQGRADSLRRHSEPDRSAFRLRIPYALSDCGGTLRDRSARVAPAFRQRRRRVPARLSAPAI